MRKALKETWLDITRSMKVLRLATLAKTWSAGGY